MTSVLPNDLGDPLLNTWILAWDAGRFAHGLRGLWDAPIFYPYSHALAYSEHLLGIAIFSAPLQWATRNPILVFNAVFLTSFVLAGGAMYLLARTLTGRRDAALIAGLIFAFTPYRFAHIAHLQMLMWGWLPLSMWALHRYWATGAFRFLLGAGAAYVLLSLSNMYLTYFGALPLAVAAVAGFLRTRQSRARALLHGTVVVALILLALAPIIRTYYQVRNEINLVRQPVETLQFSAAIEDYTRGHANLRIWRRIGGSSGEHELFPGAAAVLLSILAVATLSKREPHVRLYLIIALLAFVLSLGPSPSAWGHSLPFPGPYGWLLMAVPGLNGIRSVARLNTDVVLALAVLAAFGVAILVNRVRAPHRTFVVGALAALILAEGWAAPIRTASFDAVGEPADRDAYAYLAAAPHGAVLEMPLGLPDPALELKYQYMTLLHRHPLVNGRSGYESPLFKLLHGNDSVFSEAGRASAVITMLRAIGVRHVVVHVDACSDLDECAAFAQALDSDEVQVATRRRFNGIVIVGLTPPDDALFAAAGSSPSADLHLVPSSAIRLRASQASERLPFIVDGNRDTRWLTASNQTGREWIELALDRPRDIRRIRVQMGERSLEDYPRELAIDVIENGQTRTVFQDSVLAPYVLAFLRDPKYPVFDVVLPSNRAQALRLRQLGRTRIYFWSIHELQMWERGPF